MGHQYAVLAGLMEAVLEAKLFTESVRKGKRILLSRVLEQFEGIIIEYKG